jgi:D-sedoheptulose 7-phosphate isomerase
MSNYLKSLDECQAMLASLQELEGGVERAATRCVVSLQSGGKMLICGNGGSAAEAMHLAGELVGRYKAQRLPLAAIALGTDPVVTTCIGNDFCFDEVFSRQILALGRRGDVLVVFSASGCSANILRSLQVAREMGIESVAFLGNDGGPARILADEPLVVRHKNTARIQEGHQFLVHSLMDLLEVAAADYRKGEFENVPRNI